MQIRLIQVKRVVSTDGPVKKHVVTGGEMHAALCVRRAGMRTIRTCRSMPSRRCTSQRRKAGTC